MQREAILCELFCNLKHGGDERSGRIGGASESLDLLDTNFSTRREGEADGAYKGPDADVYRRVSDGTQNGKMDPDSTDSPIPPSKPSRPEPATSTVPDKVSSSSDSSSFLSSSSISSWAKGLKLTQPLAPANDNSSNENAVKSAFSRLTSGFGVSSPSKNPGSDGSTVGNPSAPQSCVFESFTRCLVDASMGAVKVVQVKARHIVSQNKRRYQVKNHQCNKNL